MDRAELRHFLFGTSRSDLSRYREILEDGQVWVKGRTLVFLGTEWEEVFSG
jgi:hypothetical protein